MILTKVLLYKRCVEVKWNMLVKCGSCYDTLEIFCTLWREGKERREGGGGGGGEREERERERERK